MNFTYILYLITFLGGPILGFILSKIFGLSKAAQYLKWALLFFIVHNLLFFLHFSLKGDYPDYIIFSLEYLFLCFLAFLPNKSKKTFKAMVQYIVQALLIIGFLQGLIGILMFLVIAQDCEAVGIYYFKANGKSYLTREYIFGFATLDDITYTFDTYRSYNYLPFEKRINTTIFFDTNSNLNFGSMNFKVGIKDSGANQILEFSSDDTTKQIVKIK